MVRVADQIFVDRKVDVGDSRARENVSSHVSKPARRWELKCKVVEILLRITEDQVNIGNGAEIGTLARRLAG